MSIIDGPIDFPRIGSVVNLPNGKQGTIENAYNIPFFSWLNQTIYYKVRYGDGRRIIWIFPFKDLEVVGYDGESVV